MTEAGRPPFERPDSRLLSLLLLLLLELAALAYSLNLASADSPLMDDDLEELLLLVAALCADADDEECEE